MTETLVNPWVTPTAGKKRDKQKKREKGEEARGLGGYRKGGVQKVNSWEITEFFVGDTDG